MASPVGSQPAGIVIATADDAAPDGPNHSQARGCQAVLSTARGKTPSEKLRFKSGPLCPSEPIQRKTTVPLNQRGGRFFDNTYSLAALDRAFLSGGRARARAHHGENDSGNHRNDANDGIEHDRVGLGDIDLEEAGIRHVLRGEVGDARHGQGDEAKYYQNDTDDDEWS